MTARVAWESLRARMGVESDRCLAASLGLHAATVRRHRLRLGIEKVRAVPVSPSLDWDATFWRLVHPEAISGCWLWHGSLDSSGYGQARVRGKAVRSHRVSFELANGPIPDEMCVCHRCDVPACVNPDHLFLGTRADNNADRDAKGRTRHPKKFSDEDADRMRSMLASGKSRRAVGLAFGCAHHTVTRLTAALAAVIAVLAAGALPAVAQRDDAALLLARTCVSERGFDTAGDDCAAIHAVAVRRAELRGTTLARALVELSPRLHGSEPIPRPWVRHLMPDGRRPREWRRASWARHREAWLATLAEARALVAGERPSPCVESPSSWGSRSDVAIHLRADPSLRWVDVDCGNTRNRTGRYERRRGR